MSEKQKKIFWPTLLVVLVISIALVSLAVKTRATSSSKQQAALSATAPERLAQGPATQRRNRPAVRNLSLQPEAFKLGRRLGKRFMSSRREVSVMTGTLTTGTERQPIQIMRRQNDRGERVEIAIGGGQASLSWSDEEGSKASGSDANDTERTLIERLAFDSADQFVLAQLRGASYYTVARNVRPTDAGDNYDGPLWDIIRVHDPEEDTIRKPLSNWRLYYINTRSGLIDKIVCDFRGEPVETNFVAWVQQDGEKVPSRITWTRGGQVVMEFTLTGFSHSPQQ